MFGSEKKRSGWKKLGTVPVRWKKNGSCTVELSAEMVAKLDRESSPFMTASGRGRTIKLTPTK